MRRGSFSTPSPCFIFSRVRLRMSCCSSLAAMCSRSVLFEAMFRFSSALLGDLLALRIEQYQFLATKVKCHCVFSLLIGAAGIAVGVLGHCVAPRRFVRDQPQSLFCSRRCPFFVCCHSFPAGRRGETACRSSGRTRHPED